MDVLIVLFATGLFSMFVAFAKKPMVVLLTALVGMSLAGSLLAQHWLHPYTCMQFEGLSFDKYVIAYSFIAVLFTFLIVLAGYSKFKEEIQHTGEYISLLVFSLCGAVCMLAFTDMFMYFLGLEILSLPIYVMAGSKKRDERSAEASLKYFFTGAFATGLLLFGIAWIYGATQSFKIDEMAVSIQNESANLTMVLVGLLFILASLLFKIGAVPFHFWSPDAYGGSPTIVTGYMATVIKIAGLGAFYKLFSSAFPSLYEFWMPILVFACAITILVGNLSALRQTKFKRFFAYSSITHIGYTLLAFVTQSDDSAFNIWYYIFAYGFSTIILILLSIILNDEEDEIEAFSGLIKRNPLMAICGVIALLSLAGVPPMMGFFGKYLIFSEALFNHPLLVSFAILNSGIGMYYYLKIAILMVKKSGTGETPIYTNHTQQFILLACTAMLLVGGFCFA
jgi:NADH-quinone oxidoreductase subunit N